jgi:hypothetical protein
MRQRYAEVPFAGARRVKVSFTGSVDLYIMPPDLADDGRPYNHGSLESAIRDELEDTLKYKTGWCGDAEEGDAVIAALDAGVAIVTVAPMPNPEPVDVREHAEAIESERPGG